VYAMVMHPEVQKKLHDELDHHIGEARTPSMAEIELLPYFNASWKESLRWAVPVPLGKLGNLYRYILDSRVNRGRSCQ
jgi:cytochrome P450